MYLASSICMSPKSGTTCSCCTQRTTKHWIIIYVWSSNTHVQPPWLMLVVTAGCVHLCKPRGTDIKQLLPSLGKEQTQLQNQHGNYSQVSAVILLHSQTLEHRLHFGYQQHTVDPGSGTNLSPWSWTQTKSDRNQIKLTHKVNTEPNYWIHWVLVQFKILDKIKSMHWSAT